MALGDNCTDKNWSTKGYSIPQVNVTKHMPWVKLSTYMHTICTEIFMVYKISWMLWYASDPRN